MIGILLALQVNNWNEDRKAQNLELKLLNDLKNDLDDTINHILERIRMDSITLKYGDQLIGILESDTSIYRPYMESLFGWIEPWKPFSPSRMTYENIKASGFSIIRNDTLRSNIVVLFDSQFHFQEEADASLLEIFNKGLEINYKYLKTDKVIFRIENDPMIFKLLRKQMNI